MCTSSHSRGPLTSSLFIVARIPSCPLFRDIRSYNKKFLGTSPTFQKEVVLPDNFILHTISSTVPDFEVSVRLLQGDRRPSTVKSYDQKWFKFEALKLSRLKYRMIQTSLVCVCCLCRHKRSQTVVAYLVYLLESDTINAKSLESYLSVINTVHKDNEYPSPVYEIREVPLHGNRHDRSGTKSEKESRNLRVNPIPKSEGETFSTICCKIQKGKRFHLVRSRFQKSVMTTVSPHLLNNYTELYFSSFWKLTNVVRVRDSFLTFTETRHFPG